ncbi:MAG: alpha-hydroxy-acid oxidizing protein [Thermoplasmata archaeon]|nr:MAG: alpha-hydroxy-acid oxidizing protein [Thermoplasmata archaeon]
MEENMKTGASGLRGITEEDLASIMDELALVPEGMAASFESEGISKLETEVILGEGRDVKFPLLLSHPFFVNPGEMVSANRSVRVAVAYGASTAKVPFYAGEGLVPEEKKIVKKFEGAVILPWSPFRVGVDSQEIAQAKAVSIDLTGGSLRSIYSVAHLMGKARGEEGLISARALGPKHHLDMESEKDLSGHVELLREVTGHKIPVLVKIPASRVFESTKTAIKSGADAVIIDTSENPFTRPSPITGNYGATLLGAIPPAVKALKAESGRKKGVKLLVSGGFRNGADIVKALALGADAAGINEAALVALGCVLCGECHLGACEKGIATRDKELRARFSWKDAGSQLANFLYATKKEIEMLADFVGVGRIKDLKADQLAALTYDTAAITGVKLIGYDKELPMWFH